MLLEDHRVPQITFSIVIPGAGGYYDPADTVGLASATASLMREGTTSKSTGQISESLDTMAATVSVVAIQNLHELAQRFVVGALLRETFREKEESGQRTPLSIIVLDELNKYAPREGQSPLKEMLIDIAQRGDYWHFEFDASAFLHHMVRNLMGCQIGRAHV